MQITANQTSVVPNTRYEVNGAAGTTIDITMRPPYNFMNPVFFRAGDFASFRGTGGGAWRLLASSENQYSARSTYQPSFITTIGLPGNVAPGERWEARAAGSWQAVSMEGDGSTLLAANGSGQLLLSEDAGRTWGAMGPNADWVAVSVVRFPWSYPASMSGSVYMAAAARGGALYAGTPTNGVSPVGVLPDGFDARHQDWAAVVAIEGGGVAIGAVRGGPIVSSSTGAYPALDGTGPLVRTWSSLSRSSPGFGSMGFVAVCEEGEVWTQDFSTAGPRLRRLPVMVDGQELRQPWSRVAVSGNAIALTGRNDGAIYLSTDAGQTWSRTAAPSAAYNDLSLAAAGQVIVASTAGGVRMSRDGGATFAAVPMPAGETWQALAASSDGNMLLAGSAQRLHTSLGNRTTYANVGGAILGGPGDFVELEAVGGVQFRVRSASGGPFTIR